MFRFENKSAKIKLSENELIKNEIIKNQPKIEVVEKEIFKESIRYIDSLGYDFLMKACLKKDVNMVKYALTLDFNPNTSDYYNVMTPLLILINKLDWKSVLLANILVKAGADPYKNNSMCNNAITTLKRLKLTDDKKIRYREMMMRVFQRSLEA